MEINNLVLIFLLLKFSVSQDLPSHQLHRDEIEEYVGAIGSKKFDNILLSKDEARAILKMYLEPHKLKAKIYSILPYNLFKARLGDLMKDDEVSILTQANKEYPIKLIRELFQLTTNRALDENIDENNSADKKLKEPLSIEERQILKSLENQATVIVPHLFRSNFSIMSPIINTFFPDLKNITLVKIPKQIVDYNECEEILKKAEIKFDFGQNGLNNLEKIRLDKNNQLSFVNFKFIVDHIRNKTELLLLSQKRKTSSQILPLSYWMAVGEALNTDREKFKKNLKRTEYEKIPWVGLRNVYNHSSMDSVASEFSVGSAESNVSIENVTDGPYRCADDSLDSNILLNSALKSENLDEVNSSDANSNSEDQEMKSPLLVESTSVKSNDFAPISSNISGNLENNSSLETLQSTNKPQLELESVAVETETRATQTESSINGEQSIDLTNGTKSSTNKSESSTIPSNDKDNFQNSLTAREKNILKRLENATIIVPRLFKSNFSIMSPIIDAFLPYLKNVTLVKTPEEIVTYKECEEIMNKSEMKFALPTGLNNLENIRLEKNNELSFENLEFLTHQIKNRTELWISKKRKNPFKTLPLFYWKIVGEALNVDSEKYRKNFKEEVYEKLSWVGLRNINEEKSVIPEVNNSSIVSSVESNLITENETVSDKPTYQSTGRDSLVHETLLNSQDSSIVSNSTHKLETPTTPMSLDANLKTVDQETENSPPPTKTSARESAPVDLYDLPEDESPASGSPSYSENNSSFEILQLSTSPKLESEPTNNEIETPTTQTKPSKNESSAISATEPSVSDPNSQSNQPSPVSPSTQLYYDKSRVYSEFASCLIYYLINRNEKNSTSPMFNREQTLKSDENLNFVSPPLDTASTDISSYQDPSSSEFYDDSKLFDRSNRESHEIAKPSAINLDHSHSTPSLAKRVMSEDDLFEVRKFIDQKIKDSKKRKNEERLNQLLKNKRQGLPKPNTFQTKTSNRPLTIMERNSASENEKNENIKPLSETLKDKLNPDDVLLTEIEKRFQESGNKKK